VSKKPTHPFTSGLPARKYGVTHCAAARIAGVTHDAIQPDGSGLAEFAVTSFTETHGDKWERAIEKLEELEDEMDFDPMYAALENFVAQHVSVLERLVESPG